MVPARFYHAQPDGRLRCALCPRDCQLGEGQAGFCFVRQNLGGAFGYHVPGIPVAMGVRYPRFGLLLSPLIAAAAMAFSSVTVVTNANRLRLIAPRRKAS